MASANQNAAAVNTLELASVRKSYDDFVAVNDLSFHIKAATIFGLLGPNGAGKTSTIRMIIGITVPDSRPGPYSGRAARSRPQQALWLSA